MIYRLHSVLLAAMLALAPAASFASQNSLSSPNTGTVSGLQLTNNYNNALDALNTCNSGASAPANQLSGVPSLGNCWLKTTSPPDPWQFFDGTGWVAIGYLDTANHLWNAVTGGGRANLASAATADLCASALGGANYITITGTVTITSFGSSCEVGQEKTVTFNGALLLTYNPTSLIIPGAFSRTTAAGDVAKATYLGSSNWQVTLFNPALTAVIQPITCVIILTSATTCNNGGVYANNGTFTPPVGATRLEVFEMGGAGGGGGTGTTTSGGTGVSGTVTSFNSIAANGGIGGVSNNANNPGTGGPGGTGGGGFADWRQAGGSGSNGITQSGTAINIPPGVGGASCVGSGTNSGAPPLNTGVGGPSGSSGLTTIATSGAGGGGECARLQINAPSGTYPYSVGPGGVGGNAGTSGTAGTSGSAGIIVVRAFFN